MREDELGDALHKIDDVAPPHVRKLATRMTIVAPLQRPDDGGSFQGHRPLLDTPIK